MSTSQFSAVRVLDMKPYGAVIDDESGRPVFHVLRLEHPKNDKGEPAWSRFKPGQFAMLRPQGQALDLPWARPLSICAVSDEALVFFFQIAGRGTRRMAGLRPNDVVHVWGPLGSSFAVEKSAPTLMLGGGIGLAPFVGYANAHPDRSRLTLMFSHRPPSACYPLEMVHPEVDIVDRPENTIEDRQMYLAAVAAAIEDTASKSGLVLACGPTPFLQYVRKHALTCGARAQLSLENRMGCGVGACLGCVVEPTDKNPVAGADMLPVRTCVNGPVFWADQIEIAEEA